MANTLMQARSSSSGELVSWVTDGPDFAGDEFPGPGEPEEIAVVGSSAQAAVDGGDNILGDPQDGWVATWSDDDNSAVWAPRDGLTINSFAATSPLVETGTTVTNPAFTASYSTTPTTAVLTNDADGESKDVHATPTSFSSSHSFLTSSPGDSIVFTLDAEISGGSDSANATITAAQKTWWGTSTNSNGNNEAFIEALANSALDTNAARSISVTAGANEYIYIAFPTRYGTPTFTVGGFELDSAVISTTVSVTNAHSFTENYTVVRSTNHSLGATTVVIS